MLKKNLFLVLWLAIASHSILCKLPDPEVLAQKIKEKLLKEHGKKDEEKIQQYLEKYSATKVTRAGEENPFHGWWQLVSRGYMPPSLGSETSDDPSYIYIDTTADPLPIVTSITGTPSLPRERTNLDGAQFYTEYYQPSADELVFAYDLDGPYYAPYNGVSWFSMKLQEDGQTMVAITRSRPKFAGATSLVGLYKKVDEPLQPVRPFDSTDAAFPDATNPVEMARQIYSSFTLNQLNPQNVNFNDGDYRSFYEREELFNQFLDGGIEIKTPIRRVRVSRPGEHYSQEFGVTTSDRMTDIFTDCYSYVTTGATVEIGGFEGSWACMNGKYVNGVSYMEEGAVPNPSPTHLDVCSTDDPCKKGTWCNVFNHFLLRFDSSKSKKFPHDELGYAKFCGKPWVKVKHHITPNMEYPAFRAAMEAMFYKMYRVSQHGAFNAYFKPGSAFLIDTWKELQEAVANDNLGGTDNLVRTRTNQSIPSGFFNNAVYADRGVVTYNDPFGLSQIEGSKWDYNIVLGNYVTNVKAMFWAIEGTPDLTPVGANGEPLQFDPTLVGYKPAIPGSNRANFVGALGDVTVVDGKVTSVQNPDSEYYTSFDLYAQEGLLTVEQAANGQCVGLIDTKLTKGKKVGYIRMVNALLSDYYGFVGENNFAPDVPVTAKYARQSYLKVFSNITKYLNEQNCDAVILDIRTNNGGYMNNCFNLAEFFGDDRAAISFGYSKKDNGNSDLIEYADLEFFQDVFQAYTAMFERFYVQENEQNFPGSVFKGSKDRPKKVVVLTDEAAASAGDIFPHFFLGENLDGNLGSYTTGVIIGDIDGRLKGSSGSRNPVPVSLDSNRLYDANGNPFAPIRFRQDIAAGSLKNGLTDIWYNQQSNKVAPIKAPTLRGRAGGAPLPNDWETNVWPALGLIDAPKGLFSKCIKKGKPCADKPETWRDPWLEQAILEACSKK